MADLALSTRRLTPLARRLLVAGLLALLGAAWLVTAAAQWRNERAALEMRWRSERDARLAAADQARGRRGGDGEAAPDAPAQAEARLAALLPPAAQTPRRVAELLALAQRQGLALRGTQQRLPGLQRAQSTPGRLELALQAEADYLQLRRFVAEALAQDTGLVLGSLRLQRADGRAQRLQAELQWVLLSAPPALPSSVRP